eukprot:scaffold166896_cov28-Prasinocladus_malaysianus.AAC.1
MLALRQDAADVPAPSRSLDESMSSSTRTAVDAVSEGEQIHMFLLPLSAMIIKGRRHKPACRLTLGVPIPMRAGL